MTYWQKVIKYCAMAFAIFLTISIIGGIIGAFGFLSFLFEGNSAAGEMKSYQISGEITELNINIKMADFEIKTGNEFIVESNHKYLTVKDENGKLEIKESKDFLFSYNGNVKTTITIPKNTVFKNAKIQTGAGRVSISELTAEDLDVELGAGKATIDSLTALKKARLEGGAGKVTINGGALADLKLDMGVGKISLTSQLTGDCLINHGVGSAEIVLLGKKEDYRIEVNKGLGKITVDGKNMSDGDVYGSGENKIDVDSGVGEITVNFSESW